MLNLKKFECRITRSCIYWADDKRETHNFTIEAKSLNEAKNKLYDEALRLEFSTASKLVQDVLIFVNFKWVEVKGYSVISIGDI